MISADIYTHASRAAQESVEIELWGIQDKNE